MTNSLEWVAVVISIACSTFRAFNLGHQAATYVLSAMCYVIFIYYLQGAQRVLNLFYLATAVVGAWRWKRSVGS